MTNTTRAEQKEQTRRKLIDTALAQAAEKGVSALSLREVAKAAGIAPTGFYRHFRDLDELALVLVDEVALALRQLVREARFRISGDHGRVKASVDAFLDFVRTKPHLFRLLLGERLGSSTAFRKALHQEIDRFVAELTEELEAQASEALSLPRVTRPGKPKTERTTARSISERSASGGSPLENVPFAAEAIVAVVFSVGAEAIDLPRHRHVGLSDRITREVYLILSGAGLVR